MQSVILGTAQWGLDYGVTNATGASRMRPFWRSPAWRWSSASTASTPHPRTGMQRRASGARARLRRADEGVRERHAVRRIRASVKASLRT